MGFWNSVTRQKRIGFWRQRCLFFHRKVGLKFQFFRSFSTVMRSNRKILIGVLIVAGALVVWKLFSSVNGPATPNVAQNPAPLQTVSLQTPAATQYVAAASAIPAGSIVTRDMLQMVDIKGDVPVGAIVDPDAQAVGFITRFPIKPGEALRPQNFIGHISEVGIAGALRPNMRALVVPIANKPTLHDLVKIGNFVDVIAAFDGQESRTIVQNVRVLAVDVFANDFPEVNGAMRGPYKADPKGKTPGSLADKPTANTNGSTNANGSANSQGDAENAPPAAPTPIPANAPRPDPALTLEVTPQQAAAIQLALASNAPLDFLVRPAMPASNNGEAVLVGDDGMPLDGATATYQNVSVTKAQLAPYAERKKNAKEFSPKTSRDALKDFAQGAKDIKMAMTGSGGYSGPDFPIPSGNSGSNANGMPKIEPVTVPNPPSNGTNGGSTQVAPQPSAKYDIPIYADGRVVRVETVPVPVR